MNHFLSFLSATFAIFIMDKLYITSCWTSFVCDAAEVLWTWFFQSSHSVGFDAQKIVWIVKDQTADILWNL